MGTPEKKTFHTEVEIPLEETPCETFVKSLFKYHGLTLTSDEFIELQEKIRRGETILCSKAFNFNRFLQEHFVIFEREGKKTALKILVATTGRLIAIHSNSGQGKRLKKKDRTKDRKRKRARLYN